MKDFIPRRKSIHNSLVNLNNRINNPGSENRQMNSDTDNTIPELDEPETPSPITLSKNKSKISIQKLESENGDNADNASSPM